jgi:hypothetical protein
MRRAGIVCGIAVALAWAPAAMVADAAASSPGWAITPTLNPTASGGQLLAVSCPSPTDCTAVGDYSNPSGAEVTLAEGWNGLRWSIQATPAPANGVGSLDAVSCAAPGACTAVGYAFNSAGVQISLAERWDGVSWTIQVTPNPAGVEADSLVGVSCALASACTAVGSSTTGPGTQVPLAETWSGASWSLETTPVPTGVMSSSLAAVSCAAADICSAVGSSTAINSGYGRNLAEQLAGSTWTIATTPAAADDGSLGGVSCTDQYHCVAVGSRNRRPETETWNGIRWRMEPNDLLQGSLTSISCNALEACMAVGRGIVASWNGSKWATQPTPDITFSGVSCSADSECALVGSDFLGARWQPVAERWNGSSWSSEDVTGAVAAVYSSGLSGVSCISSTQCLAVGGSTDTTVDEQVPLAERWKAGIWSIQPTPAPTAGGSLNAVSCVSAHMCVAVGRTGFGAPGAFAERWNGTAWTLETIAIPNLALYGVSCVSATNCTAVGNVFVSPTQYPAVATWNGSAWSIQALPVPAGDSFAGLAGVTCASASACIAVGDAQQTVSIGIAPTVTLAEQWIGGSWSVMPTPNPAGSIDSELKGVACTATACSATGNWNENGLAEQWNGVSWTIEAIPAPPTPSGTTFEYVNLNGVACSAPDTCIALGHYVYGAQVTGGGGALVERWNGDVWTVDSTMSPIGSDGGDLASASCEMTGSCIAVGAGANTMNTVVTVAEQYTP